MIEPKYKNELVYQRSHSVIWNPKLLEFNLWFMGRFGAPIFTSTYRPGPIHSKDSGIHSSDPLRAEDLRSYIYPDPISMEQEINDHWIYDPTRSEMRVCIYHNTGQGVHFHIQVHDNTRSR